jgi:hypothetical protein
VQDWSKSGCSRVYPSQLRQQEHWVIETLRPLLAAIPAGVLEALWMQDDIIPATPTGSDGATATLCCLLSIGGRPGGGANGANGGDGADGGESKQGGQGGKTKSGLNDGFLPQREAGEKVMRDILVRRGSDGGAGSVEVFEVQSQGRKFYRRLLFATHPEMAMHRPLVRVRAGDTLAQACARAMLSPPCGDGGAHGHSGRSTMVITRHVSEGLGHEVYVSPSHLYNIQCSEIFTLRNEKLHTEA